LATTPRWPRWGPVGLVAFLRLVVGPAAMAGLLWLGHRLSPGTAIDLWPRPAEVLILTAGVPTAVNTLLLTLELDGDAKLAADCVFWTTVLSAPTVAIWLLVLA
jgi:predicted permease